MKGPEQLQEVIMEFDKTFSNKGYKKTDSLPITSSFDPTVVFVGSHLNVMKKYFHDEKIPDEGIYAIQPSIRTQNSRYFFDDKILPNFFSCFPSLGVISNVEQKERLFNHLLYYLKEILNFKNEDIVFRVNSADGELMSLLKTVLSSQLEVDTYNEKYYRHKIGEDGISGKNFNIALKNSLTGEFADVGNFIILDCATTTRKQVVELALGGSNLLKQKQGYTHVGECFFDIDITKLNSQQILLFLKMVDSILTSITLLGEGLIPNGSKNPNKLLKSYLRSIIYFQYSLGIDFEQIKKISQNVSKYGIKDLNNSQKDQTLEKMIEFLEKIRIDIITKKVLSETEELIKDIIKKP